MSMVRCDECDRVFDSDLDCDCFGDGFVSVLCKWCRDADDVETPTKDVGQAIAALRAAMDHLIFLAKQEATRPLVCDEKKEIGKLMAHCETLCSIALAAKPRPAFFNQRAS